MFFYIYFNCRAAKTLPNRKKRQFDTKTVQIENCEEKSLKKIWSSQKFFLNLQLLICKTGIIAIKFRCTYSKTK